MTALVSILNKKAAVIAADSAVTVTRGDKAKIYNTANKIFRLSNNQPIGAMIYRSSGFMGVPWDVLFKLYRAKRSDKSFDTVKEYAEDFISFLKNEKHCKNADNQMSYFTRELSSYYYKLQDIVTRECEEVIQSQNGEDMDTEQLIKDKLYENFGIANQAFEEQGHCPELEDFSLRRLRSYAKTKFDDLMELCQEDGMPGTREEWEENFHNYIRSRFFNNETGVVFVGYGDEDIYPSLVPAHIAGIMDGCLRYYFDEEEIITNENDASIQPFAQTDTMISLMKGIHPEFYATILDKLNASLHAAKQQMLENLKVAGASESQLGRAADVDLEAISDKFHEDITTYIQDTFIDGVVYAVDSFNIEDMVKMAESLISITNLQRHFTSSEESVGGPVDVAVITKSEGFVWVNHKQWFQQEMNPQIMERK